MIEKHFEKFWDTVSNLNYIKRFQLFPRFLEQSVSEHTYWVVVLILILGKEENKGSSKKNLLDMDTLIRYAVIHDWEEAITGDIPKCTKYFDEKFFTRLEDHTMSILEKETHNICGKDFLKLDKSSREWKYIKAIDLFESYLHIRRERSSGNRALDKLYTDISHRVSKTKFKSISRIYKQLEKGKK